VDLNEVIFFGYELELLEAHLAEHRPHVKRIFVWECETTVTGEPKPLYLRDNWSRFQGYDIDAREFPGTMNPLVAPNLPQDEWWRAFRVQEHKRFPFVHAPACEGADWVRYSDTDEITPDVWWPKIPERLAAHPEWQYGEVRGAESLGFVNLKANWGGVTRYRYCRADSSLDPSIPRGHPRGTIFQGMKDWCYWHYVNCFSRPEEFHWKNRSRWETMHDAAVPQTLEAWRTADLLAVPKFMDATGPYDDRLQPEWQLPKFMLENLDRFPHIRDGQPRFPVWLRGR